MAFLRESEMRARALGRAGSRGISVPEELNRATRQRFSHYDIFLSQTIRDAEIVLGVYDLLISAGYSVFCDWIGVPDVDRSQVTPANAEFIRTIMNLSDTLLFLNTRGTVESLWMCWELGWFDGGRGPVAVLPVLSESERHYRGREFLGLYPYIELDEDGQLKVVRSVVAGQSGIKVYEAPNSKAFDSWRSEPRDFMRTQTLEGFSR